MGFKGFHRRRTGAGVFVFAAAAIAACATGEEPNRDGLPGVGGASSTSSGSAGPGSSSEASSSAGPGSSSSSVSASASSSASAGVGGTGGAGGAAGAGGAGGAGDAGGAGGAGGVNGAGGAGGAGGVNGAGGMGGAGGGAPTPTGLRVQYRAGDTNASNAEIKPHLTIFNDSPDSVMLSELSIRYWYTIDGGSQTQEFHCDYAKIGCGKIVGTFGAQAGVNADHFLQIAFVAGDVLAPGANTGEIQARFNKTGFPSFDETNDYSFDPTKLAFADWMKVTLYHNGTLVWGVEP